MPSPRPRSPVGTPHSGIGLGHPSSKGRQSSLKSRGTQLLGIRFGWVVLVIWFEVGEFFHSLSTCKFPDSQLRSRHTPSTSRRIRTQAIPSHIVLLADPHVPHPRLSYPSDSRPWMNILRQAMEELFMRKSWNVVMRLGRVDGVVVLGDMLDWGRGVMSDDDYESYFDLFMSIFQLPPSVPMYFIPGNHDIPLGPNRLFSPYARDRYAKHFSPPNAILEVANHSLILLDAVGLVEEDYRRYAAEMQFGEWDGLEGGVIEFVKGLGDEPPPGPKVLLSHIPLARPEAARCGPLRERGRILKGAGPGYQNLLGSETSRFLLEVLKPSMVFSGDDHDYCDFTHPSGIREVTLKSFSSSCGIQRPGFQLLSLLPPSPSAPYTEQTTIADRPCFLPDQAGVYYRVYLPLVILTVLYLFGTNFRAAYQRWLSAGNSIYGDLKSRLSPNLASSEKMPNAQSAARRASERPSPLSIPSWKSSQHLNGMSLTPTGTAFMRSNRLGPAFDPRSSRSAPVSPTGSPRPSFSDDRRILDDDESVIVETPPASRRGSYIYMNGSNNGYQTPGAGTSSETASYFLPIPGQSYDTRATAGLGFPMPNGTYPSSSPNIRRASSSNLSHHAGSASNSPNPLGMRRTTMPRLLSTSGWSAAARAKEKSVLGLMVDSLPVPGTAKRDKRGGREMVEAVKGFLRWMWKTRNGVLGKSWREVVAVAWPVGMCWVVVNGLFFIG